MDGWPESSKLVIDNTKIDDTLTDFPVAVLLDSSNFVFSKARSDGFDLRFMDASGALLKYERVSHDNVAETAEYWVKIPSVSSSSDTIFFMYYGNPSASDSSDPTAVWDANHVMVQHMNDATTSTITDSTANANNGTKKAANEPIEAAGQIGMAQSFDGVDDYVDTRSDMIGTGAFTICGWINPTGALTMNNVRLITNGKLSISLISYGRFTVSSDGGTTSFVSEYGIWLTGKWTHFCVSRDATGAYTNLYIDGVLTEANKNSGTPIAGTNNVSIGNALAVNRPFNGLIDEVSISNIVRSAAWDKADYYSGMDELVTHVAPTTVALTSTMDFSGSISAQNPNWLLLDDSLAWQGKWDEAHTYGLYDAILYKTADGEEWHVFVSKSIHNTGNNPTTSPAYWRRYYQEQFV